MRERFHIVEESIPCRQRLSNQPVAWVTEFELRVQQKRQEIQAQQQVRQILLSVAKIVLEVVAFGPQRIVVFVLNPLPPATRFDVGGNVVSGQLTIRSKHMPGTLGSLAIKDDQLHPVHPQCVVSVLDRHTIGEPVAPGHPLLPVPVLFGLEPGMKL